jgi:hypothetical protein
MLLNLCQKLKSFEILKRKERRAFLFENFLLRRGKSEKKSKTFCKVVYLACYNAENCGSTNQKKLLTVLEGERIATQG